MSLVGRVRPRGHRITIGPMKKGVLLAGVLGLVGLLVLAKRFGPKMSNVDWEQRFERMPDNAPPKWIFRNITAIRENTERILELLDKERSPSATEDSAST